MPLLHWKESKLLFPSTVRLSKCVTFSPELIEGKIGALSNDDKLAVITAFRQMVDSLAG